MKRISVAEAKNNLPALIHEAEAKAEPVEIHRRGKAVAVLLSLASYERLRNKETGFVAALEQFRASHDLDELDAASAFDGIRDKSTTGRPVRW